ncbi:hypothetical protein CMV_015389 [Castanea mollissima]|uniref:Uncharacterized protein n=1 Tax=Castanea mollissima TaxID=60419 RepID=A0A8J4R979_9ROSI|nr:hypothetical protein CMV_015389 [Castanea mollissima]
MVFLLNKVQCSNKVCNYDSRFYLIKGTLCFPFTTVQGNTYRFNQPAAPALPSSKLGTQHSFDIQEHPMLVNLLI